MNNLIFAIKAFWTILTNKPHVYCDTESHSVAGRSPEVEPILQKLVDAYNQAVEQEILLEEAKKLI